MLRRLRLPLSVLLALLTLVVILLRAPLPEPPRPGRVTDVLLQRVNIVDVRAGVVRRDRDLLVRSGVIARIAPGGSIDQSAAPLAVDASGRFVIPGLWDMHTHTTQLAAQYLHPLYLANGVTGVRDMWGCLTEPDSYIACHADRQRWNRALAQGRAGPPRFIAHASFQINDGNEVPPGFSDFFRLQNDGDAALLAEHYAGIGVEFLKVYSELSPGRWRELAREASARGLYLAGHRPLAVSLQDLIAEGQRSVEHPRLFLLECYREAARFRGLPDPLASYDMDLRRDLVAQHDADRCDALMQQMAASETAWVPTMQVLALGVRAGTRDFREDPRLDYIPWPLRLGMWAPDAARAVRQSESPGHADTYPALYRLAEDTLLRAHRAGVRIMLGTDAGDTGVFPGFAVHDELEALVAAGISPGAALAMATLEPARFSGMARRFGSVEVGMAADILLLRADPLTDISATRQLDAMLFNGSWFDRAALDQLLQFARNSSGSWQLNLRLLWSAIGSPIVRRQFAD